MTTVAKCKVLLEQLDGAVAVVNGPEYREAVEGLKGLQFELCQSLARERMWEKRLQEALKLGDAAFFRAMVPEIDEANHQGKKDYAAVFGD